MTNILYDRDKLLYLEEYCNLTAPAIGLAKLKIREANYVGALEVLESCCNKLDEAEKRFLAGKKS